MASFFTLKRDRLAATFALAWIVAVRCLAAGTGAPFEPTWSIPTFEQVHTQVDAWLVDAKPSEQARLAAAWHWDPGRADERGSELLARLVDTIAAALPEAAQLRRSCSAPLAGLAPPDASWLDDEQISPLVRNNLRLYYAKWLAEHRLYDETIAALDGLQPADVVDPASLLFYRMIAHQQLVQLDEARLALVQLLEREEEIPERYRQLAQLLQRDLAGLEDDSLDHISRRMNDVRRRLQYGRAGRQVQQIENGVVKSLDKKIDQLEKQRQQQQQSASQSGGSPSPSQPMKDSQLAPLKAPGRVDRRDIGHGQGWGDLPPKEREQALQQIGREFPAHYRELIEQYFRELAAESQPAAAPPASRSSSR